MWKRVLQGKSWGISMKSTVNVVIQPHLEEILALAEFNKIPVVAVRRFSWFVNEVLKDVRST